MPKRKGVYGKNGKTKVKKEKGAKKERMTIVELSKVAPEDRETLKGKSTRYIIGYNKAKYKQSFEQ